MEPDIIVFRHESCTYIFANENISCKYIQLPEDYTLLLQALYNCEAMDTGISFPQKKAVNFLIIRG